jgi:tRNA A-37 threonylcarbamoyl transferase component Bud32
MGAVWLVAQTKAFDRLAVVKEIIDYFDPTDAEARREALALFEAEARTLGDLKHPGVPDLYAYFSEGGHNYLVMEYIEGPDLRKGLTREDDSGQLRPGGPLPAEDVLRYTIQVCEVLHYLGGRQPPVVHNDIKPGNIIIDENSGRAVLVDFGTAKTRYLEATGGSDGVYGTVGYAAPELYQGRSEPRSDVYSLAATAYHLLTDDDPRDHPFKYPELDTLPAALEDIMRASLAHQIEKRPTAIQFQRLLETYLAGQTASLHALPFPGGDAADDRDKLLALAVKHWRYAANILKDGTISRWLRGTLHDSVSAQAADEAVKQWPGNPDAALDAFLRRLDPTALPPGKMQLDPATLRLVDLGPNQHIPHRVKVANQGQGYLRGEIMSTRPWLKVGSGSFACPPGQVCEVAFEIHTAGLAAGQLHLAALTLTPAGGAPEVVAVQITVAQGGQAAARATTSVPAVEVIPRRVDFGTVSRQNLSTAAEHITVTNVSAMPTRIRVQGAPKWLLVKPEGFRLDPGGMQAVRLIGRVDKLLGRRYRVKLAISVQGGKDQEVQVLMRLKR